MTTVEKDVDGSTRQKMRNYEFVLSAEPSPEDVQYLEDRLDELVAGDFRAERRASDSCRDIALEPIRV